MIERFLKKVIDDFFALTAYSPAYFQSQSAQTYFEQFGRTKDWHLRDLKMASRKTTT